MLPCGYDENPMNDFPGQPTPPTSYSFIFFLDTRTNLAVYLSNPFGHADYQGGLPPMHNLYRGKTNKKPQVRKNTEKIWVYYIIIIIGCSWCFCTTHHANDSSKIATELVALKVPQNHTAPRVQNRNSKQSIYVVTLWSVSVAKLSVTGFVYPSLLLPNHGPRRQGAKAPRLVACFNGSICHMFTSYQRMNGYSLILFSDMMNNSSSFPYTMDYGFILPSVWKCGSRFWLPSSSHDLVMIACQPLSKSCWPRYSMPWFAHNIWGQPLLFVSDFQLFHMFAW